MDIYLTARDPDTLGKLSRIRGAVLRGEKAPDDALARELGAMGLL